MVEIFAVISALRIIVLLQLSSHTFYRHFSYIYKEIEVIVTMSDHNKIKAELNNALLHEKVDWLWSYDKDNLPNQIPDKILIEKYLSMGSSEDWAKLKLAFNLQQIKRFWLKNMVPSGMFEERQKRIAKYFFSIKKPSHFLIKARQSHLKNAIAGDH